MAKKTLEEKRKELEKLQKEVAEETARLEYEKDAADANAKGLYKPIATAKVRYNLYYRGERDFEEIGDPEWYRASELLGNPEFKKDDIVVLLNVGDREAWYRVREDGNYYGIDEDEYGLDYEDCLTDINYAQS